LTQIRSHIELNFQREVIDLPDEGVLALDWAASENCNHDDPIVIILPGLSGSSSSPYVRHTADIALNNGFRTVVMNYRGTAGLALKNKIAYSAGWTEDFRFICRVIQERYPKALKVGVGYSLGSNVMVKYACEEGSNTPLNYVISLSNPYNLTLSSVTLEKTIYSTVLAHGAIRTFKLHKDKLQEWQININSDAIESARSIKVYDEHLTRVLFGFESADHYYEDAGCVQYIEGKPPNIPGLQIPVIFISARDDPLIPEEALPIKLCENNPNTLLILTKKGGHIGFNEGLWPSGKIWSDRLVEEILNAIKSSSEEGENNQVESLIT